MYGSPFINDISLDIDVFDEYMGLESDRWGKERIFLFINFKENNLILKCNYNTKNREDNLSLWKAFLEDF